MGPSYHKGPCPVQTVCTELIPCSQPSGHSLCLVGAECRFVGLICVLCLDLRVQVNFGLHDLNNNGKEVPVDIYTDNIKSIFTTIQTRQVLAVDCCDDRSISAILCKLNAAPVCVCARVCMPSIIISPANSKANLQHDHSRSARRWWWLAH